ncbi:hypothetical protein KUV50_04415 [Membranicola marinus]|uniref:Phytol kinase n=1 Tax=Membranihabitans marinus TaxID=1227546 RepID=A0A953HMQ8_9BACT|nr:hypothetical protein [Membranihabitans marinus]MBY5957368.1 hypothetical protein [Membranihabitans marinus]
MDNVLLISLGYLFGISLLLIFNEVNYRWFKIKGEYSRKIAHVLATLATLPFPFLFSSHWYVFFLAALFFVVLWSSQRIRQLNSIHDIARNSYGSYLLPLAIYFTFLGYTFSGDPVMYILPITILAICDPVAALAGMSVKKYNRTLSLPGIPTKKTVVGSFAFLCASAILSLIILNWWSEWTLNKMVLMSINIAIVSTLAELLSWRGSDNLTIPLSVQLTVWILI